MDKRKKKFEFFSFYSNELRRKLVSKNSKCEIDRFKIQKTKTKNFKMTSWFNEGGVWKRYGIDNNEEYVVFRKNDYIISGKVVNIIQEENKSIKVLEFEKCSKIFYADKETIKSYEDYDKICESIYTSDAIYSMSEDGREMFEHRVGSSVVRSYTGYIDNSSVKYNYEINDDEIEQILSNEANETIEDEESDDEQELDAKSWLVKHDINHIPLITSLNINSKIDLIPDCIGEFVNLKSLQVECCCYEVPDTLSNLTQLTDLSLSQCGLEEIPEVISTLTSLKRLNLFINKIKNIPNFISTLSNLEDLSMGENPIELLPDFIVELSSLKSLFFLCCYTIKSIPEDIGRLTNLEQLYLGCNKIDILPDSIGQLTNLFHLDICGNNINVIPDSMSLLTNLMYLHLDGDKSNIPDCIKQLKKSNENLELIID